MADILGTFYLARQQRIGCQVETNPGSLATLIAADYNILAKNVKLTLITEENIRKYVVGDAFPFLSVMGRRYAAISFSIDMQGSGEAGSDPVFFKLLRGASFALGTTSLYRYALLTLAGGASLTFGVQEVAWAAATPTGKEYLVQGCMATKCQAVWDNAGELQRLNVEYIGGLNVVQDIANGAIITPVLTDDESVPPAVLSASLNYKDVLVPSNMMSVDFGLKTELIMWPQSANGFARAVVGDFDPIANVAPLIETEAITGYYSSLVNTGTAGEFETVIGSGIGKEISIVAPNAQVVKALDLEQRSNIDSTNVMFRFIRTGSSANPCVGIFVKRA